MKNTVVIFKLEWQMLQRVQPSLTKIINLML
jgi:hypothetical protein